MRLLLRLISTRLHEFDIIRASVVLLAPRITGSSKFLFYQALQISTSYDRILRLLGSRR